MIMIVMIMIILTMIIIIIIMIITIIIIQIVTLAMPAGPRAGAAGRLEGGPQGTAPCPLLRPSPY